MNKPIVKKGSSRNEIERLRKENKYVSIPLKIWGVDETERQREIRNILNRYDYLRLDEEVEDVIDYINKNCDTSIAKLSAPFQSYPNTYNIDFGKVSAYVTITDEYLGQGEYNYSISLDGIVVENEVSNEYIEKVSMWLDEAFNGWSN